MTATTNATLPGSDTTPTRTPQEIKKWYREQIEMASLRAELAKQKRDAAVYETEQLKAIVERAQIQGGIEEMMAKQEPETAHAPGTEPVATA